MMKLVDIAALIGTAPPDVTATVADPGAVTVTGLATLDEAGPTDLSFLGADAYLPQFASTKAAAVIVQKRVKLPPDLVARRPQPPDRLCL